VCQISCKNNHFSRNHGIVIRGEPPKSLSLIGLITDFIINLFIESETRDKRSEYFI